MITCDRCKEKITEEYSQYWLEGERSGIVICSRGCAKYMMDEVNEDLQNIPRSHAEWRVAWLRFQDLVEML